LRELLEAIVFLADELDQIFVCAEPPVHAHRPGFCVGLRIVYGHVDLTTGVTQAYVADTVRSEDRVRSLGGFPPEQM